MPELPEIEVLRCHLAPLMEGKEILRAVVRKSDLRRPVSTEFMTILPGQLIMRVERRSKYLLVRCNGGNIILHLGMTGDLSILPASTVSGRHDHLDIVFTDGLCLRFHDPRRFGSAIWTKDDPLRHSLLDKLGPEPFDDSFNGRYLFKRSRSRRISVKQFIMDGNVVAGLGNIYAGEALFHSGVRPEREARALSENHYGRLRDAVREVLDKAIKEGVAAMESLNAGEIKTVYFPVTLYVYGRAGRPCHMCGTTIEKTRQGGRSSFYCPKCQR
jgi:formamidopyrimidine-DNA glycosylase